MVASQEGGTENSYSMNWASYFSSLPPFPHWGGKQWLPSLERYEDGTGYHASSTELSFTQRPVMNSGATTNGTSGAFLLPRKVGQPAPRAPAALPEVQDPPLQPWGALTCPLGCFFYIILFHLHNSPCERLGLHFTDKETEAYTDEGTARSHTSKCKVRI